MKMGKFYHAVTGLKNVAVTAAMLLLLSTLAACSFKPLYGTTESNQQLEAVLAGIEIPEIPGRVGQRVRNELIFAFYGGGHPGAPQYKLVLALTESVTSQLVERDGDSRGQFYELTTRFKLYSISNGKEPMIEGVSHAKAAFRDDESVYSNVRARINAEDRAAKTTAEDLKTRLAAFLSANS
jgi:LPS-assembly lipoprotein